MTNPVTPAAPFYLSVFAQASRVAPVVYMSSNPTMYLIQCNDKPDFAHPRVQNFDIMGIQPILYRFTDSFYLISQSVA
ncbi:hypothetical protein BSR42_11710 [Megasphaera cerevisiae]|nr:hypothetical protein BSR42_11710 [Megasphaera cerevisiae]